MKVLNKLSKNCSIYGKKYEIYGPSNFWTFVKSNIFDDWNWNFWTLLGSEIGVKGPWAFWTPQWQRLCIYFIYLLEKANCFFFHIHITQQSLFMWWYQIFLNWFFMITWGWFVIMTSNVTVSIFTNRSFCSWMHQFTLLINN